MLVDDDLGAVDGLLIRRSGRGLTAVGGVIAVGQSSAVLLNLRNGFFIDNGGVSNLDLSADVILLDRNRDSKLVCNCVIDGAVRGNIRATHGDLNVLVEGQAFAHGIGDQVGIGVKAGVVRHLTGDGVVYSLAYISADLVINLVKGHIVLVVDGGSGIGSGQVAQCAGGTGDEVVAQGQIGNRDSAISLCSQFSAGLAGNGSFQSRSEVGGAECTGSSNVVGGGAVDLGQRHAAVLLCGVRLHSREPLAGVFDGVRIRSFIGVISYIKNLVSGVGLICDGVVDGNGAGLGGKRGGGQGKYHNQGQQEAKQFSCVFHCWISFLKRI